MNTFIQKYEWKILPLHSRAVGEMQKKQKSPERVLSFWLVNKKDISVWKSIKWCPFDKFIMYMKLLAWSKCFYPCSICVNLIIFMYLGIMSQLLCDQRHSLVAESLLDDWEGETEVFNIGIFSKAACQHLVLRIAQGPGVSIMWSGRVSYGFRYCNLHYKERHGCALSQWDTNHPHTQRFAYNIAAKNC